jgi:hypothetical protein
MQACMMIQADYYQVAPLIQPTYAWATLIPILSIMLARHYSSST